MHMGFQIRLSFSFWVEHCLTCVTLNKLPDLSGFQFLICKMGALVESIVESSCEQ